MNSRFSTGLQAGRTLTFVSDRISLMTPEGVQQLMLPEDSAYSVLSTRGDGVGHRERRELDSYECRHIAYFSADDAVVDEIHPVPLKWTVKRSDIIIIWGCGIYTATLAKVEAKLVDHKRILLIKTTCEAEADWFNRVNRLADPLTPVMRLQCASLDVPGTVRNAGAMLRPEVPR